MAPDVEAKALVLDGPRQAADLVVGLEHESGTALLQELVCRREASGAGADNYASLSVVTTILVRFGELRHKGCTLDYSLRREPRNGAYNGGSQSPVRFCMLTTFYPPLHFGGDGVFVYRLCHALAELGHEIDVVHSADAFDLLSSGDSGDSGEPIAGFPEHPRVRRHPLKNGVLDLVAVQQTGRPVRSHRYLQELLADGGFDVIHYHNVSLLGGPGILRFGSALKLYTLHEHWLVCPMHVLWRYDREPCNERTCIRCQLKAHRPPQLWRHGGMLKRCMRSINLFLAPSEFTLYKHRELGLDVPLRLLPHFVPEPIGRAEASEAEAVERDFFLFAGRIERLKGVDTLLEAFESYRDADLLIAGDGSQRQALESRARHLPHIRFLGRVTPEVLSGHYQRALACLVPSLCYEVFGLTAAESFAHGTPAVVRNRGALPELIAESGAGFCFDSTADLIEKLQRIQRAPALRQEMSDRAREKYEREWRLDVHIDQYLGLIDELSAAAGMGQQR